MSDSEGGQHRVRSSDDTSNKGKVLRKVKTRRAPKKQDTHFLCLPLVNDISVPQLAKSIAYFQSITSQPEAEDDGVSSQAAQSTSLDIEEKTKRLKIVNQKAFRPPGTYHLTLGVMDLSTAEKMKKALDLLQNIDIKQMLSDASSEVTTSRPETRRKQSTLPESATSTQTRNIQAANLLSLTRPVSPPSKTTTTPTPTLIQASTTSNANPNTRIPQPPISITLTGLSTFPNATTARVLYAKPHDPTSRLHNFATHIRQSFRQAGLITETRALVLHATVANLRYATAKSNHNKRQAAHIDAREIIKVLDHQGGRQQIGSDTETEAVNTLGVKLSRKEEYTWAKDVVIDHLAICKLGATKSDDDVLGLVYPPIATRSIVYDDGDEGKEREEGV